jgi:hypothetical protein
LFLQNLPIEPVLQTELSGQSSSRGIISFDLSSQAVSDILAYIRNKAMDLMRVPNPQQKIPKMGIAVFRSFSSRVERRSFRREQAGYKGVGSAAPNEPITGFTLDTGLKFVPVFKNRILKERSRLETTLSVVA